jgi:hypothetical protein
VNNLVLVSFGVATVLLIILAGLTARYRRQGQVVPNYRAMFVSGLLFIPMALSTNLGLLAVGMVLSVVGWRNRDKWGRHTRWADYPPALKRLKLAFAGGLGTLAVSVAIFLIISNGQ